MAAEQKVIEGAMHGAESAANVAASAEHAAEAAHGSGIHIALAAEKLGTFLGIPITNTLITAWIVMALLIVVGVFAGTRARLVPSRIQLLFEMAFEYAYDFMTRILENRNVARRYFPLLMTLFLFIFVSNAVEFTPGIGSITFDTADGHSYPLLRSVNTDLNVTLALTIITVIMIEIAGVFALGLFRYAGKFINFSGRTIGERILNFAVGLIELVSEAGRLVSFSFRLFGNIFAGEVLIAVVMFFVPYILPVPLMAFEMFVGFIQAVVFAMLALFFIKIAITPPHTSDAH